MAGDEEVEVAAVAKADDGGVAEADGVKRTKLLTPSRLSMLSLVEVEGSLCEVAGV